MLLRLPSPSSLLLRQGVALVGILVIVHEQVIELLVSQVVAIVYLLSNSVATTILFVLLSFIGLC